MSRKTKKKKSARRKKTESFWERLTGDGDSQRWENFKRGCWIFLLIGVWTTVAVLGLNYLEHYVKQLPQYQKMSLAVELDSPPDWAGDELLEEICLTTGLKADDFILDEQLTAKLWHNLLDQNQSPWVKHVKHIRKRYDGKVIIDCELRRPLASVSQGSRVCYIDAEGVVLPIVPLDGRDSHLVQVRGIDVRLPSPGEPVNSRSLMAGIEVLALIRATDEKLKTQDRLWHELAVMDISNFEGKINPVNPHLVLFTHHNTEIRWGAAVGYSRPYYEASAKDKISMLYRNHRVRNSLEVFEYVDLRNQRQERTPPLRDTGRKGDNGI